MHGGWLGVANAATAATFELAGLGATAMALGATVPSGPAHPTNSPTPNATAVLKRPNNGQGAARPPHPTTTTLQHPATTPIDQATTPPRHTASTQPAGWHAAPSTTSLPPWPPIMMASWEPALHQQGRAQGHMCPMCPISEYRITSAVLKHPMSGGFRKSITNFLIIRGFEPNVHYNII